MRSMTGYGKGQASADGRKVTVEIKTVNHKFFDWSMKMPKGFLFVEDDAKKTVATAVNRGHIDVFVTYEQESTLRRHANSRTPRASNSTSRRMRL